MGSGVQIPRNQFGLIWSKIESLSWSLHWTLASILVLQIVSYPFKLFLKSESISDFPFENGAI
jgi:hypothetical protein